TRAQGGPGDGGAALEEIAAADALAPGGPVRSVCHFSRLRRWRHYGHLNSDGEISLLCYAPQMSLIHYQAEASSLRILAAASIAMCRYLPANDNAPPSEPMVGA